ncbi:hypothetical protein KC19_VG005800 [Ceratodon purpureus]|uniref:Uncharacterized protein n=1 Tax=Ceratodon purpureus TaxID=3225 RepID=A0A8T0HKM8_CERPU|nr:hypothetical protein KC19_VG005800 [Ceratodon purpureus]
MAMKATLCINDAHHLEVECCCYNHDRNEIFTGSRDCLIKAWDIESGRQLRVQQQHTNWVMGLIYVSEPVKMLFSCSLDGNILVWNERGRLLQVIEYGGPVYCLAWDGKQRQLLAGGRGAVQVFKVLRPSTNYMQTDSERKSMVKFLEFNYCTIAHDDTVQAICCSSKGKVFTTG